MTAASSFPPIGDYAIIGDCRSAALVSRDGSIDWLCWPRFDSPSLFGALLDRERGGYCRIGPVDAYTSARCYLPGTPVLQTTFRTATGSIRVTDCMPAASDTAHRRTLLPDRQLLRVVEGLDGVVNTAIDYCPRPDFGANVPELRARGALGIYCHRKGRVTVMRCSAPITVDATGSRCTAQVILRAGEKHHLAIAYADRDELVLPVLGDFADRQLQDTIGWWQQWSARDRYQGAWPAVVARSAITLKLLCFAPSGAVVAAPTTSLPERIGGARNWDYRYCWIRDASLTLQALFDLGYAEEAEAFLSWLLYTTRITRPNLQIMYDVYGGHRLRERALTELSGYAGSRPVRVGNGAHDQLQLDVYGEALDAIYAFQSRGGQLDRSSLRMVRGWAGVAAERWNDADNGIWESRAASEQHTYSLAMCWVALQRYCQLIEVGDPASADAARYRAVQEQIRQCIEARGFNRTLGCYVSRLDGDDVDASLLMLARHGYADPASAAMTATYQRIVDRLGRNGLLYRYLADDGLPPGEGTFGICSFWAVSQLALAGRLDEAEQLFNHLLGFANDLGLYAEEIDADSGAALGNFPQAFTHVGVIDAALTIEHCRGGKARGTEPVTGEPLS